jgi:tRNA (adenine37-N6)-methyltransferase
MNFTIQEIGFVKSTRTDPIDDYWLNEKSYIEINQEIGNECLLGIDSFSHIEVLYYFHKVDDSKIIISSEHPRENTNWPKIGIFAQRKKARPNKIGATICKIDHIESNRIYVIGLDAINGSPVIDIKPIMNEYLPKDDIKQPKWVEEMMIHYWK